MLKHEYIYFKLEFSYLKYQNAHYNMEVARVGLLWEDLECLREVGKSKIC